jgi:hypothetical protein
VRESVCKCYQVGLWRIGFVLHFGGLSALFCECRCAIGTEAASLWIVPMSSARIIAVTVMGDGMAESKNYEGNMEDEGT